MSGRGQAVEKVAVGSIGGPKEVRTKLKTLPKQRFSVPEWEAEKSAKGFFNTLGCSVNFALTEF
jgi:hypothetical protein